MKRSIALRADDIFSGVMLPLVSSRMPRLTGTRSLLNCAISCCSPSSKMLKSSLVRPVTKCPLSSLTVAVTLTSSTPLLNLNASSCVAAAERDAIARHIRDVRHIHDKRRLVARRQRAEVERRAPARDERTVAVERENHRCQTIHLHTRRRILHETGHGERRPL